MLRSPPAAGRLVVPALRCHMGDRTYFAAVLTFGDLAGRVRLAQDLHVSTSLNDLIQRAVEARAGDISAYLLDHARDRFFNSLVVGVYGGMPAWYPLEVRDNPHLRPEEIPAALGGVLGILVLDGTEGLFALDGQHRLVGIAGALEDQPALAAEQITALFVAYERADEGLVRTRRLFTTLNRYAKPTSKRDDIALDEDDAVAIVVRRLLDEHPVLRDRVSVRRTKSLPATDQTSVTTLVALYDVMNAYLRARRAVAPRKWAAYKRTRPEDAELDELYGDAAAFWDLLAEHVPLIGEVAGLEAGAPLPVGARGRDGGHLLFRPIGLNVLVSAAVRFVERGESPEGAVARLAAVPMALAAPPWVGLLWDPTNRRMITAGENQQAAVRVLYYGSGGPLDDFGTTPARLREALAGLRNQPVADMRLRRYWRASS